MIQDEFCFVPSPDAVVSTARVLWIGALSFEERFLSSIDRIHECAGTVASAVYLDYGSAVYPKDFGLKALEGNRANLLKRVGERRCVRSRIHAHRLSDMYATLQACRDRVGDLDITAVVIDVSCITKLHAIAVADFLLSGEFPIPVIIAYSRPDYYGVGDRQNRLRARWRPTLVARVQVDGFAALGGGTDAIVLLGHEGGRLRLALHETDPGRALVLDIQGRDSDDRDIAQTATRENGSLLSEINDGLRPGFQLQRGSLERAADFLRLVEEWAIRAKSEQKRLVLCPFGQKISVMLCASRILRTYREGLWYSYPPAVSVSAHYSTGYRDTLWVTLQHDRPQTSLELA